LLRRPEVADDAFDVAFDAIGEGQCRIAVHRAIALGLFGKVTREVLDAVKYSDRRRHAATASRHV
jgi:hypothetical protein